MDASGIHLLHSRRKPDDTDFLSATYSGVFQRRKISMLVDPKQILVVFLHKFFLLLVGSHKQYLKGALWAADYTAYS